MVLSPCHLHEPWHGPWHHGKGLKTLVFPRCRLALRSAMYRREKQLRLTATRSTSTSPAWTIVRPLLAGALSPRQLHEPWYRPWHHCNGLKTLVSREAGWPCEVPCAE